MQRIATIDFQDKKGVVIDLVHIGTLGAGLYCGNYDFSAAPMMKRFLHGLERVWGEREGIVEVPPKEQYLSYGVALWFTHSDLISRDNGCGCGSHAFLTFATNDILNLKDTIALVIKDLKWEDVAQNYDL